MSDKDNEISTNPDNVSVKDLLNMHEDGEWDARASQLTPQQRKFVDVYVFDSVCAGNWDRAARKAGYKSTHIITLKRKPHIVDAIKARKKFLYKNKTISDVEAVSDLRTLWNLAQSEKNFPAMTAAVKMKLEIAGLIGDGDSRASAKSITNNTQINLTAENRRAIAGKLTDITQSVAAAVETAKKG